MTTEQGPRNPRRYRIGIDVGTHSVGLAAVEYDSGGTPTSILSAMSHIHDAGVLEAKTATTRLAAAGVARRVRRLHRRRVRRLRRLDRTLANWGWRPLVDNGDPYLPWRARARLATEYIPDEAERHAYLATALRHIARHRGWRSPYSRVSSLYEAALQSPFLAGDPEKGVDGFRQRVEQAVGRRFADDVTVAELAVAAIEHDHRPLRMGKTTNKVRELRRDRDFSYIGGKLWQSDNANEIRAYARTQGLSREQLTEIVDVVFAAESPRGSWLGRVGKDPLDGQPRALKASDAFQRFRIVSTLANVRVRADGAERRLSAEELAKASEYILSLGPEDQPTWGDIAEVIGHPRKALAGTASRNADGEERMPARPPVHVTDQKIRKFKGSTAVRDFWADADDDRRDALISLIADGIQDETKAAGGAAWQMVAQLPDSELETLDTLELPQGRAAYSVTSLRRLTDHMLKTGDDLHAARKTVFGVDDKWVPPADPVGAPVGNPAVDRTFKVIARYLAAAMAEWGCPERVVIEHVRSGFKSEKAARDIDREMQLRHRAKLEQRAIVRRSVKVDGEIRDADVRRFEAVQRQNSQCLYCGATIDYDTAEMDHIVPRKGPGCSNTRNNLAAACISCNRSKSNRPFAVWAAEHDGDRVSVPEAIERTRHWQRDPGLTAKRWNLFLREVRDRLEQTEEDPPIDARSMESVAWMASELRGRIEAYLRGSDPAGGSKAVFVYRGALTAWARRAGGIEGRIPWIGGGGKTRFDRRHHAVDAAVLTLLDESVARTLAERTSIRDEEDYRRNGTQNWKGHQGSSPAAVARFGTWKTQMETLASMLARDFSEDRVVVAENLRLRLGNGRFHEDTINPLVRRRVGDAFTRDEIDAASTPQLWIALTRDPDFDERSGLPENPARRLRVQGTWLDAQDEIRFFDKPRAALAVRGGWAELGTVHHARIYRWEQKGKPKYGMLRVFSADLAKHRHQNLFAVPPDASWVSMRAAHHSIGRANLSDYEYLGWLVPGDEVLVTRNAPTIPGVGPIERWRVVGFEDSTRINVRPRLLASEGLDVFFKETKLGDAETVEVRKFVERGARWTVGRAFEQFRPVVVRRDALGRPRLVSTSGLPTCWQAR